MKRPGSLRTDPAGWARHTRNSPTAPSGRLFRIFGTAAAVLFLSIGHLHAQFDRDLEPPPQPTNQEAIPSMEGDEEFGDQVILTRTANWYPWSFDISLSAFHTDNAELSPRGGQDDNFLREVVTIGYTQAIAGDLFVDIGLRQEAFRYESLPGLDFDYLRTHAGVYYYFNPEKTDFAPLRHGSVFANYSYYGVSDGLFNQRSFDNHSAIFGYQNYFPTLKGHQVYYGVTGEWSLSANQAIFRRHEYRGHIGYSVEWTENLSARAGYVASYFDYLDSGQSDWNHYVEVAGNLILLRPTIFKTEGELYAHLTAIYDFNHSNTDTQDYEYWQLGGGIGFRLRF